MFALEIFLWSHFLATGIFTSVPPSSSLWYTDYLTHSSLEIVSATLGSDVELRCIKMIEVRELDTVETAACHPGHVEDCFHRWSKNGTVIEADINKYLFKNKTTTGYCESFYDTTKLYNESNFFGNISTLDKDCFSSAMIIKNVTLNDIGNYTCNFTYHGNESWYQTKTISVAIIKLTLDDIPPKNTVVFLERFDQYKAGDTYSSLFQCVTTGSAPSWYFQSGDYSDYWSKTDRKNWTKYDQFQNMDSVWRCFNLSYHQSTPYQNVHQSLLVVKNICNLDWTGVECRSSDETIKNNGHLYISSPKDEYWNRWYYGYGRYPEMVIGISMSVLLPVLAVLLLAFSGIACCRANLCVCGQRDFRLVTIQTVSVPTAQTVEDQSS